MKLRDVVALVTEQFVPAGSAENIAVAFSKTAWHPGEQWHDNIEHQAQKGIYFFCEDAGRSPASESDAEVWYVGMANNNAPRPIAKRIFAHLGFVSDPITKQPLENSPHHRWNDNLEIDETYKKAIENRAFIVYTAAASGGGPNLPGDIESFVLHAIQDKEHKLPPLNRQLPR